MCDNSLIVGGDFTPLVYKHINDQRFSHFIKAFYIYIYTDMPELIN